MGTRKKGKGNNTTIPLHVVAEFILPCAGARELVRLRSVCKSWRQLIDDPEFIHHYLTRHNLTAHETRPLFFASNIRSNGSTDHQHGYRVITTNDWSWRSLVTRDLIGMHINLDSTNDRIKGYGKPTEMLTLKDWCFNMHPPCKGLVLLRKFLHSLFLCNPATGESAALPSHRHSVVPDCYGFGFDDHSKVFKILHNKYWIQAPSVGPRSEHEILSIGKDSSWRHLGFFPRPFVFLTRNGIASNNCLHWLAIVNFDKAIFTFDLRKEKFREKTLPRKLARLYTGDRSALFVVEDRLVVLNRNRKKIAMDVWVLTDYKNEFWIKSHHISLQSVDGLYPEYYSDEALTLLAIWEDEILFYFVPKTLMLVYNTKLKTFRRLILDNGDGVLASRDHCGPWYIYKHDPRSAFFVSSLLS